MRSSKWNFSILDYYIFANCLNDSVQIKKKKRIRYEHKWFPILDFVSFSFVFLFINFEFSYSKCAVCINQTMQSPLTNEVKITINAQCLNGFRILDMWECIYYHDNMWISFILSLFFLAFCSTNLEFSLFVFVFFFRFFVVIAYIVYCCISHFNNIVVWHVCSLWQKVIFQWRKTGSDDQTSNIFEMNEKKQEQQQNEKKIAPGKTK